MKPSLGDKLEDEETYFEFNSNDIVCNIYRLLSWEEKMSLFLFLPFFRLFPCDVEDANLFPVTPWLRHTN